jgi:DedD protein
MAERKAAEDEFNPRHRIVGAVILVALAVIFLPMLLHEQPPATHTTGLTDTPVAETRVVVAPPRTDRPSAASARPADKPVPGVTTRMVTVPVEPAPAKPTPGPVKVEAAQPAGEPAARTEPVKSPAQVGAKLEPVAKPVAKAGAPAAGGKRWIVQVGVFSQPDNARRLQEKLKAKGYAATLDPSPPVKGKTVRVEVGPYAEEKAAKNAAARIQGDFGIKGIVHSD